MDNNKNPYFEKYKDKLNICISFTITVLLVIAIGFLIYKLVPNTLDVEYIEQNYIHDITNFEAEQSERMQYIVLTILFPLLYIGIYKILQKINFNIEDTATAYNIFLILNIIIIIELIFLAITTSEANYGLGFTIPVGIVSILCGFIIFLYRKVRANTILKYFLYIVTAIIIEAIFFLSINPTLSQNFFMAHHVDAYYYPILKTASGLTPYIDFAPLYGCYSYVFAFIQNIFNNYSLMFFSIIIGTLVGIVLINFATTIFINIKNKALAFVTIAAMLFPMIIHSYANNIAPYLQYMPHRVLFTSIILLYITMYLKHRNTSKKLLLQIIGFIISTFAIFWNVETGLIVLIVWTLFLGYEILFFNSLKNKKTYFLIFKIIIMALLSVIATYLLIAIISYIRTGQIVSIKDLVAYQLLFYQDGYFMLKMQIGRPWMLLIYTYLIGLAIALRKLYLVNNKNRVLFNKYAIIFVLSILGIGIFSYYQGRSHYNVLLPVMYPSIILIGIFTDDLIRKISISKIKRYQIPNIIITVINVSVLLIFASHTITLLISNEEIKKYMNKQELPDETVLADFSQYGTSNLEFITEYESLYYEKYKLKDTKKIPAKVDLFTYEDWKNVIKFIEETEKDVVIDATLHKSILEKFEEEYNKVLENITIFEKDEAHIILIKNK